MTHDESMHMFYEKLELMEGRLDQAEVAMEQMLLCFTLSINCLIASITSEEQFDKELFLKQTVKHLMRFNAAILAAETKVHRTDAAIEAIEAVKRVEAIIDRMHSHD